jgi:hypothetical protein
MGVEVSIVNPSKRISFTGYGIIIIHPGFRYFAITAICH